MSPTYQLRDAQVRIADGGFLLEMTGSGTVTVPDQPPDPPTPTLSDWSVTPTTGPAGTEFVWEVTYQHPGGLTPSFACLVLVYPNIPPGNDPRQWISMSTADGRRYRAAVALPEGQYAYQFEFGVAGTTYGTPGVTGPVVSSAGPGPTPVMGPLVRCAADPRYFARPDGKRVLLAGSHTWDTIQDFRTSEATPRFDFPAFVAWLQANGHNFTRLWRWEYNWWQNDFLGAPQAVDPHPWPRPQNNQPRAADGLWKFDLSHLDQAYLTRLEDRVADLEAAGIYCSVMLFEGCVSSQFPGDPWRYHPFASGNNLQGIEVISPSEFYSLADNQVVQVQTEYVRRVVELLNPHRNLLWEISNETMASSYEWQCHLVDFIRQVEAGLPLQHPVGMTAMVRGGTDEQLVAGPADWISPGMANYQVPTFPNTTGKVVLLDTDHVWGLGGTAEWVRQAVANGYNPIFMDPYLGNVVPGAWNGNDPATWQALRQAMGDAQRQMNGA